MTYKNLIYTSIPFFVVCGLVLLLLSQIQFTPWPEMLLWPFLISHGWLPYRDIGIAHSPLLPTILSLFEHYFKTGTIQLKIYTWSLILCTAWIVFKFARNKYQIACAWFVLFIYLVLVIRYQSNGLWFESLLAPVSLLTFTAFKSRKYWLSGILFGLAFLTKQTAFWFLGPIGLSLLVNRNFSGLGKFIISALSVAAIFIFTVWYLQILPDYFFWSIKYGITELPSLSQKVYPALGQLITGMWPFLIILTIPFVKSRLKFFEYFLWGIAGMMGVFPRWELFHFQPALPFLALLIGHAFFQIKPIGLIVKSWLIFYLVITLVLAIRAVSIDWHQPDRFFEPEVYQIISYIKLSTTSSDKIFVLNSWDHIYAMSNRLPASKPWIPGLYWVMNLPGMQQRVVNSLVENPPSEIIFKDHDVQGLGSYRFDILENYIFSHFHKAAYFGSGYWILLPVKK